MKRTDQPDGSNTVLTEQRGRVLVITLNRPDALNAINSDLSSGLLAAVRRLDDSDDLRVGVVAGAGRGLCAGMDLKAFAQGDGIGPMMGFFKDGADKPLICAVEGFALAGGLEIALACDMIVAARGAQLGIPEVRVGLFAAGGGLARLSSRVGFGPAMELALTGDPITAERGAELGLVTRLVEPGESMSTAISLAERIAENAPMAVAASKQLVRRSQGATESEYWDLQEPIMHDVFTSEDAKEGPRAFAAKRVPVWTGA